MKSSNDSVLRWWSCALWEREREREREFYSQLHCRHTRRAISPSKLVPILSNRPTYNEQYTKENIHRQRRNRQCGKKQTNEKKNKLCAHTITRQARTTSNNTILSMIILHLDDDDDLTCAMRCSSSMTFSIDRWDALRSAPSRTCSSVMYVR